MQDKEQPSALTSGCKRCKGKNEGAASSNTDQRHILPGEQHNAKDIGIQQRTGKGKQKKHSIPSFTKAAMLLRWRSFAYLR